MIGGRTITQLVVAVGEKPRLRDDSQPPPGELTNELSGNQRCVLDAVAGPVPGLVEGGQQ